MGKLKSGGEQLFPRGQRLKVRDKKVSGRRAEHAVSASHGHGLLGTLTAFREPPTGPR